MNPEFVTILQKLIAEQGKETLLNTAKCKALLADYTRGEYKKENRLLLQALDAGVQKSIDKAENIVICKKQQIRLLHEEYSLDEKVSADVVDTLALILRGDDPNSNAKALIERGKEYYRNNDRDNANRQFDEAINVLNTVIKNNPNDFSAYTLRGGAYYLKDQNDAAISDFNEAIRLDPSNAFAYESRGKAYANEEQYDAAIKDYTEAIRCDPNNAIAAYMGRGMAYTYKGKYEAVIRELNEAVRLDPNNALAFVIRGEFYKHKGQKKQAIQDFEKALSLDSDMGWVRKELEEIQ